MWPFSRREPKKKKRRRHVELPLYSRVPLSGYVTRLEPASFNGVRLDRKSSFRVDGIHYYDEDIGAEVAAEFGGGLFRVRYYEQDAKQVYRGTYTFRLPYDPLIHGLPIEPKRRKR